VSVLIAVAPSSASGCEYPIECRGDHPVPSDVWMDILLRSGRKRAHPSPAADFHHVDWQASPAVSSYRQCAVSPECSRNIGTGCSKLLKSRSELNIEGVSSCY
jgi:hypothetical protein